MFGMVIDTHDYTCAKDVLGILKRNMKNQFSDILNLFCFSPSALYDKKGV